MDDRIRAAFEEIQADEELIEKTLAYLHRNSVKRQRRAGFQSRMKRMGAITAVLVITMGIITNRVYFKAIAHVSIEVNPSVELSINRFDRVISTYAHNGEGEGILNSSRIWGMDYTEAMNQLVNIIKADGYIGENVIVTVTVQSENEDKERMICELLTEYMSERIKGEEATAEISVYAVEAEVWNNAHKCNMSPAKYLAIRELMEVDEEATLESYSEASIRQIRERTQECHNRMTGEERTSTGSEEIAEEEYGNRHGHRHMGKH